METVSILLVAGVAILLLVVFFKLIAKPIGKVLKLLIHAAFGYILLFVVNFFFGSESFNLELNLVNCLVAGLGGVPGVIVLIVYKLFFI